VQDFEFVSSSVALFANVEMSIMFQGFLISTHLHARKAAGLELGILVERMLG
jgi:hypothetical protein